MSAVIDMLTLADWVRVLISGGSLIALARMAYRYRRWVAAPTDERFLWLAVALLATSIGYSALDLIGSGVPGSERLVLGVIAVAYLHVALALADRRHKALTDRRRRALPFSGPDRRTPTQEP